MSLPKILSSIAVVALTATATFAFTGPTNAPGAADSSAGSMLYQMAGSTFNTSTDSLEAIRNKIDSMPFTFSSSNVGIGKAPSQKLDVNGNISASRVYGVQWGDISGRPSGLDDGDQVGITSESDPQVGSTTNGSWCIGNGSQVTCNQSAPLMSSPTTRPSATITAQNSSGEGGELHFAGSGGYGGVSLDNYMGDMRFHTFADGKGLQVLNGYVSALAYYHSSDRNLKTGIETISDPIAKVQALRGVTFDWKNSGQPSVGLIAQEVEEVFPELIGENSRGYKTVEYANLVAVLIEAVKAQQVQIDDLAAQVQTLQNK